MKKLLFTLAFCLMSASLWADKVVVFETDPHGYYPTVIPLDFHNNGVTFSVYGTAWDGGFSYYNYDWSSLSTREGTIKKVVIEHPTCDFVFSVGSGTTVDQSIVWTGDAAEINLRPVDDRAYSGRVIVTVDDYSGLQDGEVTLICIYQNEEENYCKTLDDEYILLYGDLQNSFANGDTIKGEVTIEKYDDWVNFMAEGTWQLVGQGPKVKPTAMTVEQLTPALAYHYLSFDDVTIDFTESDIDLLLMSDKTGDLNLFNRYGISVTPSVQPDVNVDQEVNIATLNALIDRILSGNVRIPSKERLYDVDGFLMYDDGQYELIPIYICAKRPEPSDDINEDGEVNLCDVNCLIDYILNM
jgi:hypothetical protein